MKQKPKVTTYGFTELRPYETLVVNTTPHKLSYYKLYIALVLLVILWSSLLFVIFSENFSDLYFLMSYMVFVLVIISIIYVYSKYVIMHHTSIKILTYIWLILFSIAFTYTTLLFISAEIERNFPGFWWEQILGLPIALSSIFFALIILLLAGILKNLAMIYAPEHRIPITISSTVMMLFSLLTFFQNIYLQLITLRLHFFIGFAFMTIATTIVIGAYLFYRSGLRFIVTNQRIIIIDQFFETKVSERPYEQIIEITVNQSFLGKKYDFGDITITTVLTTADSDEKLKSQHTIIGIRRPYLVKNALNALSMFSKISQHSGFRAQ